MSFLDTKHKRKSAILTSLIGIAILLLIFMFGMTYFDPPKEYGIAVNFGTTDFGSGNVQPKEALKPAQQEPEVTEEVVEEEVVEEEVVEQEQVEESAPVEDSAEDVITQNNEEAIAIKKREDAKRKKDEAKKREDDRIKKEAEDEAKREAEVERKKIEAEQKRVAEEKRRIEKDKQEKAAKRRKLDAMMSGISDGDGKATSGEGNDNKPGDKGKNTGDPNSDKYYGGRGGGTGGNYQLGDRKALKPPDPKDDCVNQFGIVVVQIYVDKTGKVISARAGVKGTKNTSPCLLDRAKEAALKTRFTSDSNAQPKQIGKIIYNFSQKN